MTEQGEQEPDRPDNVIPIFGWLDPAQQHQICLKLICEFFMKNNDRFGSSRRGRKGRLRLIRPQPNSPDPDLPPGA